MRVLTLLPSINIEAEITCTLAIVGVDHLPNYEALSYSWGAKGDNCPDPIYIDGHAMTVSSNLEAALRALRLPSKPKTLWIDAVCINQNDVDEREIQVMIMGTIYSKAKRVLIWLGVPSEDSALAMSSLANLKSKKSLEQISPPAHKAIENLISRPYSWFSRVWVVQEFTLGRNIVFMCGTDFFQWAGIESFLGTLLRSRGGLSPYERESNTSSEKIDLLPRSDVWTRLLMERRGMLAPGYGNYKTDKSIHALLESHIKLDVTNPHDRIYGFLGVAQTYGLSFSGVVKNIGKALGLSSSVSPPTVDYKRPVHEVFTDWAKWMIESEKSLGILFTCQMTTIEDDLPSWAPSWKTRPDDQLIPKFSDAMVMFHASTRVLMLVNNNKQVTTSSVKYTFSADNSLLSVIGILLATFDDSYTFKEVEPDYERRLFEFLPSGYLSGVSSSLLDHSKNYQAHKKAIKVQIGTTYQIAKDYKATREKTPARIEKIRRVICTNRKQFQSTSGKTGLVPKQTRYGDMIVLIVGVETPFVLRPDDGKYVLIGEAFAEGCMKSEKAGGKRETFVIK